MERLLETDGWVLFICKDDTIQTIHTTLNKDILYKYGASHVKRGALFDLDKFAYVSYRDDLKKVIVLDHQPTIEDFKNYSKVDSEVLYFASRFI